MSLATMSREKPASHDDSVAPSSVASESRSAQKAIWIASYPKSGNTWVRAFLRNLTNELAGGPSAPANINELRESVERESLAPAFAQALGKLVEQASAREIAAARSAVQHGLAARHDGRFFVKTHNAVANVEGFPTIDFGIARAAIYIVRNPLDVAMSYARYSSVSFDTVIEVMADEGGQVQPGARRVYEFMGSWSFHVASWLSIPHRPVLVVRYEDLLAAPERSFGRLARFLGHAPTEVQLKQAIEHSSFAELARQEAENGFIEKPREAERFFRSGRMGEWRNVLSDAQVRAVVARHAPMMMRMGYVGELSTGYSTPICAEPS